jgi:hypothetical protein
VFFFRAALGFSIILVRPSCGGRFSSSSVVMLYCFSLYSIFDTGFLLLGFSVMYKSSYCMV